ncbi:MAG: hypothetical protein QM296_13255 [Bacillota bacterium]|nr:hypothetical protein [Bacillota bacterium]
MDKNCAGAPESGQERKNWPWLAKKGRLCPGIGAGAKKLSTAGQKLRWCPRIGAGTKKLAMAGQKLRWCPRIGAGTKKLAMAINPNWRCSTAAFYFLFNTHEAAANELIGSSCAGDTCCAALKREHQKRSREAKKRLYLRIGQEL